MKHLSFALFLATAACSAPGPVVASYPDAQRIVEQVAAKHPDVVRLTVHAVPSQGERCRVIASNVEDKLDDWSDPEDLSVLDSSTPIALQEGANLDYTAAVVSASGKPIATVGVTVRGADEQTKLAEAKQVAGELSAAILAAGKPLW